MGVERLFARGGLDSFARAVGQYPIALLIVHQVGDHDLVQDLLMHSCVLDRRQRLDAAVEIARHQIRG